MAATAEQIETLYAERYEAFVRVLAGMLHDRERAHDAVQEAFARALAKRRKYRGDGPLERWVWRIAVRTAFGAARRDRRRNAISTPPAEQADEGADSPTRLALAAALAALPERQRLAIFLRYFADLSYADIAAVAGMSEGTVGATLAHARAALAQALQPEGVETQ